LIGEEGVMYEPEPEINQQVARAVAACPVQAMQAQEGSESGEQTP
jgi:ferredoxin